MEVVDPSVESLVACFHSILISILRSFPPVEENNDLVINTLHLRAVVSLVQPCISMPAGWSKTCLVLRIIQQLS